MSMESFKEFLCPYCGQPNEVGIDHSGGKRQSFVTDCEICCNPILIRMELSGDELVNFEAVKENA